MHAVRAAAQVRPEIMVPLVGDVAELANQEGLVRRVAGQVSCFSLPASCGVAVTPCSA